MPPSKMNYTRRMAENQLDASFGSLEPELRDELATSLVRQWLTYDGSAILLTPKHTFRFQLTRLEGGSTQVVRVVEDGGYIHRIRASRVPAEQIPSVLHELNVRQRARCSTDYGEDLRIRIDPAKPLLSIEYARDEDE